MAPILRLLSGEILEVGEARCLQEMGVFKIRWKEDTGEADRRIFDAWVLV